MDLYVHDWVSDNWNSALGKEHLYADEDEDYSDVWLDPPDVDAANPSSASEEEVSMVRVHFPDKFRSLRSQYVFPEKNGEEAFRVSLNNCQHFNAQGGKSKVKFFKTADERFIVKELQKVEMNSFLRFAPKYYDHLVEAARAKKQSTLAKILGVYQVAVKRRGRWKVLKVIVMENLLAGLSPHHSLHVYDLKGALSHKTETLTSRFSGFASPPAQSPDAPASPRSGPVSPSRSPRQNKWHSELDLDSSGQEGGGGDGPGSPPPPQGYPDELHKAVHRRLSDVTMSVGKSVMLSDQEDEPETGGVSSTLVVHKDEDLLEVPPIKLEPEELKCLTDALERDTAFLERPVGGHQGVMDYSLLVAVDHEKHVIKMGLIDYLREYTLDKRLETRFKDAQNTLRGAKTRPTVIAPHEYKKRFMSAIGAYFVVSEDQVQDVKLVSIDDEKDKAKDVNLQ